MVKNYTSNWILFAVLLISFNFSYSQSNHTVTFTGNASDFNEAEGISANNNLHYYITSDEDYMYFGAFRTTTDFSNADYLTLYFDTDPQPSITAGTGSTTGVPFDGRTPILPFSANHRITVRGRISQGPSTVVAHHKHTGSSWNEESSIFTSNSGKKHIEIRIPKSTIENPNGIYFSMFLTKSGGNFAGYSGAGYPIKFTGNTSTGYFGGIGLSTEGVLPTTHTNTPILHTLTNDNPSNGVKYAHIEINDGFYTAPGNIEIVAGGTANIAAGSALTVDGTFTNNGLVTLQSTSISYSSLIATAVAGNGITKYNRHVNRNASVGQNDLISAPLSGQSFGDFAAANSNIVSNPGNSAQKLFGPFNKTTGDYQTYYTDNSSDANTILAPGIGYRSASNIVYPSDSGGPFTFTGSVNTGMISVPIENSSNEFAKWNLIGNPYPSYISMQALINDNLQQFDSSFGGIYGYVGHNPGKWAVRNVVNSETLLIAPGQGFYVLSKADGGNFIFNSALRSAGNTDDFIPLRSDAPEDKASLRLMILSESKSFSTDIYFDIAGTLDHDLGYDSGLLENPSFSIYSSLVEDKDNRNTPLAIQTLPYSILETEVIVPIGIKATQGEQIKISGIDILDYPLPLPSTVEVYFEDNVANTSTLLNNSDYIFTPSTNLSGSTRFSLRFTNNTLSINNPIFDGLQIYSPINTGNLIVKGYVKEVTALDIFDLNGRLTNIFSKT